MESAQRLLTVREAAERLAIREGTLRFWLRNGKLTRVYLGRSVRIPSLAIEDLIRAGTVPARRAAPPAGAEEEPSRRRSARVR